MLAFARPYRFQLLTFLVLVVASSALVVVTPLLLKRIIDQGVIPGNRGVVVTVSLIVAALAFVDAGLTLVQRWLSSRIGE
ncbi:MAG TPA: hypothetical protein VFX41_03410, partial [Actinomycetales bacterium]|nr:hypothetical protein [Actinomycetales bacterium]